MINGIEYLKKTYPNRNPKDYQPSGLDLRIGKLYECDPYESPLIGIIGGKKMLPPLRQVKPIWVNTVEEEPYEAFELKPNIPYIVEVQEQIQIGHNNAQFYLPRSTLLRSFVTVDTALGDLGYNGHLQFLMINHGFTPYYLEVGERFVQLVDFEVTGGTESYNGDYQEVKE